MTLLKNKPETPPPPFPVKTSERSFLKVEYFLYKIANEMTIFYFVCLLDEIKRDMKIISIISSINNISHPFQKPRVTEMRVKRIIAHVAIELDKE